MGDYELTFIAQDYLTHTEELNLDEAGDFELNIEMFYSEFAINPEAIEETVGLEDSTEIELRISNAGNGPLSYTTYRHLWGDNPAFWEFRRSYNVGEILDDARIQGVVFGNDRFYAAGGNDRAPTIYVFNRDFELIETFDQPPALEGDIRGLRDLAWDGELLWGTWRNTVYGIDTEGNVIHEWVSQYNPTVAIAWDPDREALWLSTSVSNPVGFTREGQRINDLMVIRQGLRIYGLAYWQDDPEGYNLYFFHKERDTNRSVVHKFNPDNGDSAFVVYLDDQNDGYPAGAFITNQWDVFSWIFMAIKDLSLADGGDQLEIWQIDNRKDWFQIEPPEGVVEAESDETLTLTLNTSGWPAVELAGDIIFTHDGIGGEFRLPVQLNIVDLSIGDSEEEIPGTMTLKSLYPNPFNSTAILNYSLNSPSLVSIRIFDLNGRNVSTLVNSQQSPGDHQAVIMGDDMASGVYLVSLKADEVELIEKIVLIR